MLTITKFSTFCVNFDYYADYVPVISTITNLVDLVLKGVSLCLDEKTLETSHYFTYLETKSLGRCLLLLIPGFGIGFIFIDIYYLFQACGLEDLAADAKHIGQKTAAFHIYEKAASCGSSEAMYELGLLLLERPTKDEEKLKSAKRCLRNAASLGHEGAQNKLLSLFAKPAQAS